MARPRLRFVRLALPLLLLLPTAVARADDAIHARRATSSISVDGKLDEPAWSAAPVYDHFVETFPQDGVPAPEAFRTEVRVLFDDEFLYVGVHCRDPHPELVNRQLSRRDTLPTSDDVEVALDPLHQGTTGYDFIVNAAGVQRDQLLFADVNSTDSWDAVWDGQAHLDPDGWTAELAIPLRVLRFSQQHDQVWGIHVRRVIPRTHQTLDSSYLPRNANPVTQGALVVSRFSPLADLAGLEPKHDIELAPYVAARVTARPQFSDPSRPHPTLLDPTADVGLDLKSALTSSLNLSVAVNPDFGQVEADQIIQNVSTVEAFFPEKRPFFTQGLDLFQPVGTEYGSPQQLFYSRRVGLDTPILGAAKLTGSVREGTEVGVLDAVVMGAGNPSLVPAAYLGGDLTPFEAHPDRGWQYHLNQPFHFGPNDALPGIRPTSFNDFAAVVRQQLIPGSTVGAMFTSAVPLADSCTRGEFATDADFASAGCSPTGTNAAALDWNLRTHDGSWGVLGQVDASQALGGSPDGRMLRDGTVLHAGDLGYGGYLRAGKLGGAPFRFDVSAVYEAPKLDLNQLGFQQFNDYQWYDLTLHYVRPSGFGPFHSAQVDYVLDALNWSADGRLRRGDNHILNASLQLPSYDTLQLNLAFEQPEFDTREIPGAGVGVERSNDLAAFVGIATDPNRALSGFAGVGAAKTLSHGAVPGGWGWQASSNLTWHPAPFLESYLSLDLAHKLLGARYVDALDGDDKLFGLQKPAFLSTTFRQQLVLTPRLTLQAYAQLFSGAIEYASYFHAPIDGRDRLHIVDLAPLSFTGNENQHFSAINLNLVARWEYRLGSILYVVYTRSQQELPAPDGVASTSVLPSRLAKGPVAQTFLVKWSYWWDV